MELININQDIVTQIENIIEQAQRNVAVTVNHELLFSYWQIGKLIADGERSSGMNDSSSQNFILALSKILSTEFGKGFSRSNLFNMRNFYINYPNVQTVSGQLSWSHYFEDLYILEFLGIPDTKPLKESELEKKLVEQIENFLLELGRGFMFVGTQQRITLNNVHYAVDMVFYNKILKAYVLIDLKIGKFKLENAGQMNGYINYYKTEINAPDDNPPIGIILCAGKDEIVAEYALGGLEN